MLRANSGNPENESVGYWDMIESINIDLCFLLLEKKAASHDKWVEINKALNKVWQKAGSPGKKAAEMEQLQFLIYAFSTAKTSAKIPYYFPAPKEEKMPAIRKNDCGP